MHTGSTSWTPSLTFTCKFLFPSTSRPSKGMGGTPPRPRCSGSRELKGPLALLLARVGNLPLAGATICIHQTRCHNSPADHYDYSIPAFGGSSQPELFRAALAFALDYAILARLRKERPFVPEAHVVMAGAPSNLKFAFRKWDENAGGRLKVGMGQVKVFPLISVLAAAQEH
jgi:hypothetical protein